MRMDLSLLDEDKIPYWQQRISEVYDRQAARVVQKAAGVAAANLAREAALGAEREKELWEEECNGAICGKCHCFKTSNTYTLMQKEGMVYKH